MAGDVPQDADDAAGGQGCLRVVEFGRERDCEPPGHGDDTRTYGPFLDGLSLYFGFVNRGKESIVLDLKAGADRAVFLNMVRRADVLAENYRPGVMARLGFSYEELAKLNPRLVYASSSGFGQTGPLKASPAYDTIIQAMSGIMDMTGFPDGPPTRVGVSLIDSAVPSARGIEAHPLDTIEKMNGIVLAFFNAYLKGEGSFTATGE